MEPAARAAAQNAQGYCDVEFDLEVGARGKRSAAVEDRICALMNAPAALVVNNCAGAVMLMLSAPLTQPKGSWSVVVSSSRLAAASGPRCDASSGREAQGGRHNEQDTSGDFEAALTEDVAGILRVHPPNFKQIGFVHQPSLAEWHPVPRV